MHYAADITGAEIMRTLRDEARNRAADIKVLEFSPAVELILNEHGHCAGAVLYNLETEEYFIVKAKARGHGHRWVRKTSHAGLHDHQSLWSDRGRPRHGYRAGVKVCFLHTVQYHPTGAVFPSRQKSFDYRKGEGGRGQCPHIDGEQFVNEREPRDVESASFIRECREVGKGIPTGSGKIGIWLDSPMIEILMGKGAVKREFPGKFILFSRYGIDISKEPMLVYPTLHYQNGGLEYNNRCEPPSQGSSLRERFRAGFMARTGSWETPFSMSVSLGGLGDQCGELHQREIQRREIDLRSRPKVSQGAGRGRDYNRPSCSNATS